MKELNWFEKADFESIYKANKIPKQFNYHVDYWLIGKGNGYVDAKKIGPIMFLILYIVLSWACLFLAYKMEDYTYLLTSNTFTGQSRLDFIQSRLTYYFENGSYNRFIFGLFLSVLFFLLSLHFTFSPYPRPVRFNQKNGLVYTKFMGKVWVADWNKTKVTLWRGTNPFTFIYSTHRALAVCLYSLDKNNHVIEHVVLLSGINNNRLDDIKLGGDPCVLYWNWLNQYMQGAKFESHVAKGKSSKKTIPDPKIGRLWILEKLLRFRGYRFSKSIDQKAIELDAKIRSVGRYPKFTVSEVPNNPFFTWQYLYPEREMPNPDGTLASEQPREITDPVQLKIIEISDQLAEKGIENIYQHFRLYELEAALVSNKVKSNEEIALIKLYIEEGGYQYKETEEASLHALQNSDEDTINQQAILEKLKQQATMDRAKELEAIVKKQGITKSYRDYTLASLKKAIAADTSKSPEELELIKLYIELGGYEGQR